MVQGNPWEFKCRWDFLGQVLENTEVSFLDGIACNATWWHMEACPGAWALICAASSCRGTQHSTSLGVLDDTASFTSQ
eukprot:8912196-Pyramimonas_sp.AAC.1